MSRQAAFRERLQAAVDAIFAGNVSGAAEGLGVSQPTLHKILSGRTRESKGSTIAHLADRLGVSEAWLRGEPDPSLDELTATHLPVVLGQLLVIRYFSRQVRDNQEWLSNLGQPTTDPGGRIVAAYERWRAQHDTHYQILGDVLNACYFGMLDAQAREGKRPTPPAEHLDVMRTAVAADLGLLRLVVSALRRLGEAPQPERDSRKQPVAGRAARGGTAAGENPRRSPKG